MHRTSGIRPLQVLPNKDQSLSIFVQLINCEQVNAPICDQNVQVKYMALIAAYWGHYTPLYVHFLSLQNRVTCVCHLLQYI